MNQLERVTMFFYNSPYFEMFLLLELDIKRYILSVRLPQLHGLTSQVLLQW